MGAQHNPGPWMATVGNRGTLCVVSGDAWICGELSNGNGELPGEAAANARLIAAAPDLLTSLRECADDLEKALAARGFRNDPKVAAARAAISKATGEA